MDSVKIFFIGLLLTGLILFFGCSNESKDAANNAAPVSGDSEKPSGSSDKPIVDSGSAGSSVSKNSPVDSLAEKVSECEKNPQAIGRDACFKNLALSEFNESFCDRIVLPDIQTNTLQQTIDSCKREVLLASAINSKNSENCASLFTEFDRDKCFEAIAISLKDLAVCAKISQLNSKDNCYQEIAVLSKNDSVCSSIASPPVLNVCHSRVAVAASDSSICEKIEQAIVVKDQCFLDIVKVTKNKSLCGKIFTDNLKRVCESV